MKRLIEIRTVLVFVFQKTAAEESKKLRQMTGMVSRGFQEGFWLDHNLTLKL